jgi:hypothetical protein
MAADAGGFLLVNVMTTHAAMFGVDGVHRALKGNSLALVASRKCVTLDAGCHAFVMAGTAGRVEVFVTQMRKGNRIELARSYVMFLGTEQNEVGLSAIQPLGIFDPSNLHLSLEVVASRAFDWTGIRYVGMAAHASPVRRRRQGRHVVVSLGKMTVPASGFLTLGVVRLFRFFVVLVMATGALLSQAFNVPVMEGPIEPHGQAGRDELDVSPVTVPADRWA